MGQTQSELWLMLMLYDSLPGGDIHFDTLLTNEGPEYFHVMITAVNILRSADLCDILQYKMQQRTNVSLIYTKA